MSGVLVISGWRPEGTQPPIQTRISVIYPIWDESSRRKEQKNELGFQFLDKGLSEPRRRRRDRDSGRLHSRSLGTCIALAARNDRAGVAHAAAGRGGDADHWLLAAPLGLVPQELRGISLGRAADLADHDNRGGLGVGQKHFQHVDEL